MATIQKHHAGGWIARVRRAGVNRSAKFLRKADAEAWANKIEVDIQTGKAGGIVSRSFAELINKYNHEVISKRISGRAESLRLARFVREDPLAQVMLPDLGPENIVAWRNRRLMQVSPASVRREWTTLSAACTLAIKEWRWLHINPFSGVTRPENPLPRDRRIGPDEIDRILLACGFDYGVICETQQARVGAAFLFAIETALRAGEICVLRPADVDREARIVRVTATEVGARKTGHGRIVPLSKAALAVLEQLPDGADRVFGLLPASLDALFRKARARALLDDLHFHDTRREALTRMAAKVDVMTLAKISGHRDLRILQAVYYAPNMSEIAARLD